MNSCRRPALFRVGRVIAGLGLVWSMAVAQAQNLAPNPELRRNAEGGPGWRMAEGDLAHGSWTGSPADRGLRIEGTGDDAGAWRTERIGLVPGGLYRVHLTGRREGGASGGSAVAGTSRVNRDFPLGPEFREEVFAFVHPHDAGPDFLRLGQWHVRGALEFQQVQMFPAVAVHERSGSGDSSLELGEAESVRGGVYRFEPDFGWEGSTAHRPLVADRAGFNSNRWLFQPGAEVIYRLGAGRARQTQARVRIGINHHTGGTLVVEASRGEGSDWVELGRLDGQRRNGTFEVPGGLLPAEAVRVRLKQADAGAGFQVDTFSYEARLAGAVPDFEGGTRFAEIHASDPRLGLEVDRFGSKPKSPNTVSAELRLENRSPSSMWVQVSIDSAAEAKLTGGVRMRLPLPPGISTPLALPGPVAFVAGEFPVRLTVAGEDGRPLAVAVTTFRCGILDEAQYGGLIGTSNGVAAWWCDSMRKVGRHRMVPSATVGGLDPDGIRIELARGEDEAAQLVLNPDRNDVLHEVTVDGFEDARGRPVAGLEVRVNEVAYVHVTQPTDPSCLRGWYPDPLPPLRSSLPLRAGENQPLWVTVRAGRDVPAGLARGTLALRTYRGTVRVPIQVRVFDFELPRETHLRTAFGLGSGILDRYHRLGRREDRVAVFEKYLRNFAEHRISPYSFFDHAPIDVRFVTEPGGTSKVARVDFAAFDAAAERWLGEAGFNTFQLPLPGMGGGTFHSRHLGRLEGYEEGTPEHTRLFRDSLGQVERHLRERGWLSKAFAYWFDEPDPKDYEFVVAGMKRLKEAAPGLRRMLTEQPEPALLGNVDIWCGLTPEWTPETVRARRAAGEEVWWYLCTAPKAPYLTLFLDHPGTELRLWPWQSWQYGVTGLLVWATVYWSSPLAYPEPGTQDPWQDPMSWVSGYGFPVGHRAPWGNGDGRFLYPPRPDPARAADAGPLLVDPVDSIRWENLRDGMEDYEYLWLLRQEVDRVATMPGTSPEGLLTEARGLLVVPETLSRDLTRFTSIHGPIQRHRRAVAEAIERLRRIR